MFKKEFIRLTDCKTNEPIYIRISEIKVVRPIIVKETREKVTLIKIDDDPIFVKQKSFEVYGIINKLKIKDNDKKCTYECKCDCNCNCKDKKEDE